MPSTAKTWIYAKRGSTGAIRTALALTPVFAAPYCDALADWWTENGETQARELLELLENAGWADPDVAPVLTWAMLPQQLPLDFGPSPGSFLDQYTWPGDASGDPLDFRCLSVSAGTHGDLWAFLGRLPAPFTKTVPIKTLISAADALAAS